MRMTESVRKGRVSEEVQSGGSEVGERREGESEGGRSERRGSEKDLG